MSSRSTPDVDAALDLPPGYRLEPETGAWLTLPWPDDPAELPPSLGPGIIRWGESHLVHHLTGQPWRWTRGQRRFIHLWFAVRPDGGWLYRSGVKRGSKGTGKDPFAASLAWVAACGPCQLVDFDSRGRPVGRARRMALVQVASNSEAQSKDVLRVVNAMVSRDLADEVGVDPGLLQTKLASGTLIEVLTASERSSEGDPADDIFLNESHHMTESSGGHRIAEVARRNVAKGPEGLARVLELTNAHEVGADSVGEQSYLAWQEKVSGGNRGRMDILYDSREAPAGLDLSQPAQVMRGLAAAYADAPWVSRERIADEVYDPRTTYEQSVRFYFNALTAAADAWVDPGRFDAGARPTELVADRERLALFFDGSKSDDATGLMGVRISDGYAVTLGMWQRPRGWRHDRPWTVPRAEVDAAVRAVFDRYDPVAFYADPSPATDDETEANYWLPLLDEWHAAFRSRLQVWATPGRGGHAVLFDMRLSSSGGRDRNRRFTEMAMRLADQIDEDGPATVLHDGDARLRLHVHNARRKPNAWGRSLGKENRDSQRKVDLAVCLVGAHLARRDVQMAAKPLERQRTGAVWGV